MPGSRTAPELWIAGYPSARTGASAELDHTIDLWRAHGVDVHLVPFQTPDRGTRRSVSKRGGITHDFAPDIFADKIVVAFNELEFLRRLSAIEAAGPPKTVVWADAASERQAVVAEAHRRGHIDRFAFCSQYQADRLTRALQALGPVTPLDDYLPYIRAPSTFRTTPVGPEYRVGRISRAAAGRFSKDHWRVFERVLAPRPVRVVIGGWGRDARFRSGPVPGGLSVELHRPFAVSTDKLLGGLHCLLLKTGGGDAMSRVVLEAFARGVPVVVEDAAVFPELVEHGVTGFVCPTADEMSYRASELAFDEELRQRIARAAFDRLHETHGSADRCWSAWAALLGVDATSPADARAAANTAAAAEPPAPGPAPAAAEPKAKKPSATKAAAKKKDAAARKPAATKAAAKKPAATKAAAKKPAEKKDAAPEATKPAATKAAARKPAAKQPASDSDAS